MAEPNHLRRVGILWLLASAVATPLVVLLIGPIVPPAMRASRPTARSSTTPCCSAWSHR